MFSAFSTALSALTAHATAVGVVGNNLANTNTSGFKASTVSFHELVAQSLGTGLGDTQVGLGLGRPLTVRQFFQGAIQASNAPLDVAIQGDGFFIVRDGAGALLYTRGGNLQVDKNGALLTSTGEHVQGWREVDGVLNTSGAIGDLTVPVGTIKPPSVTESFSLNVNLNGGAAAGDEFSTSIEVFDSLGGPHTISVSFTKGAAANTWDYSITVPDEDVAAPVAPVTGTLTFDGTGRLTSPLAADPQPSIVVAGLNNGAEDFEVTWQLYDKLTPRVTQFSQPSAVSSNSQDGSAAAQLVRVGLSDGGNLMAQYSNGQQLVIGQTAMASIRNPESLIAVGNNNFQLSARTANPAVGVPGTGGRGAVLGGAIESSTVDIAREFTNLIVLQRAYQANTRVVTTVDELSQETINLKR